MRLARNPCALYSATTIPIMSNIVSTVFIRQSRLSIGDFLISLSSIPIKVLIVPAPSSIDISSDALIRKILPLLLTAVVNSECMSGESSMLEM